MKAQGAGAGGTTLGQNPHDYSVGILSLLSNQIPNRFAFVEAEKVRLSPVAKDNEWIRQAFPHLFQGGQQDRG